MTIRIETNKPELIAAVSHFTSTEEFRYYICGVYIQPADDGGLYFVATDGRRLCVAHDPDATMTGSTGCILSAAKPDWRKLDGKKAHRLVIDDKQATTFKQVCDGGFLPETMFLVDYIDGSYPDWQRVLPTGAHDVCRATFSSAYLAEFDKVRKSLDRARTTPLTLRGDDYRSPHWVDFGESDIFAVIMPYAAPDAAPFSPPAWLPGNRAAVA